MPKRKPNPALPLAFALALALHAAVLPLVLWGVEPEPVVPPADVGVVSLSVQDAAVAGQTLPVTATLRYVGPEADPLDPMDVHYTVYIQPHESLGHAFPFGHMQTLGSGSVQIAGPETALNLDLLLPSDADGLYTLRFQLAMPKDALYDANGANNFRTAALYIDGPQRPELQVYPAKLPKQATLGGTAFMSYHVINRGDGWANAPGAGPFTAGGGWQDTVYLSTDTTLDESDLPLRAFTRRAPLGPYESYSHERVALDLPRVPAGNYHLILVADAGQILDQPAFTAGYDTQEIELVDTNLPDLAIASIASPRSATLGQPFTLQWEAANLGSVSTDYAGPGSGGREDAVYLSRDDRLDPTDLRLTAQTTDTPLAAQERRHQPAVSVTIPDEPQYAPGKWHLIVTADDTDTIDEGPFEDNNAFAVPITLHAPADEDEPELGEPDNDPRLTVAWIEQERIEEHMARLTETIQPAIQNLVDPDPNAPLVRDPKPPAPPAVALQPGGAPRDPAQPIDASEQDSARPMPPVPDAPDTNTAPNTANNSPQAVPERSEGADQTPSNPTDRTAESESNTDTDSQTDSQTPAQRDSDTDETNPDDNDSDTASEVMEPSEGDTPNDNAPSEEPTERDGDADNDDEMDETTQAPQPAEQDSDTPEGDPIPPSSPSEEQETTRAPRDDAEADPTDTTPDRLRLEEGNVLVGQGVRVNTSRIRRGSTTSRLTAIPRDTDVRVVFDNEGKVVEAEILGEGTGYADWDARLLEALYRWTAEGPDIENADPHYVLQLEYQFGLLNRRE